MAKVYFSEDIDKILDKVDFSKLGNNVAIKVHFGEMGCVTYISPELVKAVYERIISLGKSATLVECNVLYKGSRTNRTDHIKTAILHGFDFAPIDILDGELGNEEIDVDIGSGIINPVKLGAELNKYDSMIVLTHFKGHIDAGYGGAFKNIGMGLGSRAGKLQMHSSTKPFVKSEKCIGCGKCNVHCNYSAIEIYNNNNNKENPSSLFHNNKEKAIIDSKKCVGCAMCIAVCPEGAVQVPWGTSSHEEVCKKIVDYSRGVLKIIPNTIYINFLINITKDCDCFGIKQIPIINDIGILYSEDIVAIDKASLNLVNKKSEGNFEKINNIDKNIQIDYAYSKGMGEKNYELIEL